MILKIPKELRMKLDKKGAFFSLLAITPLVDTLNGWYVLKHGETGVSIGTFYRLFIIAYIVFLCITNIKKEYFGAILSMLYFPISSIIRALLVDGSYISAFTYGAKWLLPIIIIYGIVSVEKDNIENTSIKILEFWSWLIPGLLVVEYIFQIGEIAYFDAGFRGLFYCTNDIGYSLSMMMIFSLYRFFFKEKSLSTIVPLLLNAMAIVILSTKSCFLFTIATLFLFMIKKIKIKYLSPSLVLKFAVVVVAITIGISILINILSSELTAMLMRYLNFFNTVMSQGFSINNLLGFLTSARTFRIEGVISELTSNFSLGKLLFGWMPPYFYGAIEMDWLDSIFQHGVIGLILLIVNYKSIFINKRYESPFQYMLVISFICAFFSGHVLNGALPSTVFSLVVGSAICSIKSEKNDRVLK